MLWLLYVRMLHSALLHTANWAVDSCSLDTWTVEQLSSIFLRYVNFWRELEDARKMREEEEKSLYRYRAETFGDALTEEQRDENEIKSLFPNFNHVCNRRLIIRIIIMVLNY